MATKTKKGDVVEVAAVGEPAQVQVTARVVDPPELPQPVRAQVSTGVAEVTIGGKTVALNRDQLTELKRDVDRAFAVIA